MKYNAHWILQGLIYQYEREREPLDSEASIVKRITGCVLYRVWQGFNDLEPAKLNQLGGACFHRRP